MTKITRTMPGRKLPHGGAHACLAATLACMLAAGPIGADPNNTVKNINSALPALSGDFPIAVWLQNPSNARRYKQAGFNLYVGLWAGPTDNQLASLKAAGMPVICEQNATGLRHKKDPIIAAWMHEDEPDNAQPITNAGGKPAGYGLCVPPAHVIDEYTRMHLADPTRPTMLNLGQGVANDAWMGRGSGASINDYLTYVKGGDLISFDVYPVAGLGLPDRLWYVPKGVDRLNRWTEGSKPIWTCIECTDINGKGKAAPNQVRAEVWMALIHGAKGLIYFAHQFKPSFDEHALLDDPIMLPVITSINEQVHSLSPVLASPSRPELANGQSSAGDAPIDILVKQWQGSTYVFAVDMRNLPTNGTFMVRGLQDKTSADVLGEGRRISVNNGQFRDSFKPYDVHLYKIH